MQDQPPISPAVAGPRPPSPPWAPPLVVDVAWFEPAPGGAPQDKDLEPILLALYDTLQRPVPEAHKVSFGERSAPANKPSGSSYLLALQPGVGIPVFMGRSLPDIATFSTGMRRGRGNGEEDGPARFVLHSRTWQPPPVEGAAMQADSDLESGPR